MTKIFISYKYGDTSVQYLQKFDSIGRISTEPTTARHYVNVIQKHIGLLDYINKGENDGEDLSGFKDSTIESRLRDKIYDSSVTIVLISKNMKDPSIPESDQWIPWEISYSLREQPRNDRISRTNSMLAVVLPDENGSYEYFVENVGCPHCNSVNWKTKTLFSILDKNMFNRVQPLTTTCSGNNHGTIHKGNDHSYIYPVRWDKFIANVSHHIDFAKDINKNIDDYEITVNLL